MIRTELVETLPAIERNQDSSALWRDADFLRVWGAQSVSLFGSAITGLALPLLAAIKLDVSPLQMGLLAAAGTSPFLIFSLFAGVWVDRRTRRPILIATDLLQALLLVSIPVAVWFDLLTIGQLFVVAFVCGVLTVLFEIAHYAYVPSLVGRDRVMEANGRLQISHSAAESAGPGVAGILVQIASAPIAILLDAVSFILSALFVGRVTTKETPPPPMRARSTRQDIAEGMHALLGHRLLRPIVIASMQDNLFTGGIAAMFVLYATRELDIGPLALGLIFAARGIGAIPGAMLSTPVAQRFGIGKAITYGWLIGSGSWLLMPFATGRASIPLLMAGMFIGRVALTILNVQQWSLRQILTPDELQGRVTASHRFLVYGAEPIGALLGGIVAEIIGLRPAIAIFASAAMIAPLIVWRSPVYRVGTTIEVVVP